MANIRPLYLSRITGIRSPASGQGVEGYLLGLGATPRELMRRPPGFTYRRLIVASRMDNLKGSLEAPVAFGILTTIGLSPEPIQDVVVNIFGLKGTAIMTNVVGPQEQIHLAGAPLKALMFWVPQSGHLGLGVSILSYAGQVWLGIISDAGLVPDPQTIVTGFRSEFEALLARAGEAEKAPDIADLSARLDQALATADALLEQKRATNSPETSGPAHCQALTKAGKPCKNRPLPGSLYCRVHQP